VIRDILHRIRDRWPCRVIVWPVVVQGDAAAAQVAGALRGFDALDGSGPIPRPDVLIVARGGGSVEDLWAFNDEALARAVFACRIPLISAVGHETDTTLIDFVSDRRAPTPTAAAEMATPVLAELKGFLGDLSARMHRCGGRTVEDRRGRIEAAERALRRVPDLVRLAEQRFDIVSGRLAAGLAKNAAAHERELVRVSSRLSPLLLQRPQAVQRQRLDSVTARMQPAMGRGLDRASERLASLSKLYGSVDPDRPLQRGFARVTRADGAIVHAGAALAAGEEVSIKFGDRVTRQAVIDGPAGSAPPAPPIPAATAPKPSKPKPKPGSDSGASNQGDLF
jgi:exodeoxyribonuclease VII large subunit